MQPAKVAMGSKAGSKAGGKAGGKMEGSVYSDPRTLAQQIPGRARVRATKSDKGLPEDVQVVASLPCRPGGLQIVIGYGDITKEQVDVVVNAANSKLTHGAGLAKAIVKAAGGDVIMRESYQWLSAHGQVKTGELAVTSGGRMSAKKVFHVVGPIYHDGKSGERDKLEKSIANILMKADELGMESVSVPAISSGLFRYPKDECAEVLIRGALEFDASPTKKTGSLKQIRFTNFDKNTVDHFVHEIRNVQRRLASSS